MNYNRLNAMRTIQWYLFGEQFIESKTRFPGSNLDHFNAWCQTVELRAFRKEQELQKIIKELRRLADESGVTVEEMNDRLCGFYLEEADLRKAIDSDTK